MSNMYYASIFFLLINSLSSISVFTNPPAARKEKKVSCRCNHQMRIYKLRKKQKKNHWDFKNMSWYCPACQCWKSYTKINSGGCVLITDEQVLPKKDVTNKRKEKQPVSRNESTQHYSELNTKKPKKNLPPNKLNRRVDHEITMILNILSLAIDNSVAHLYGVLQYDLQYLAFSKKDEIFEKRGYILSLIHRARLDDSLKKLIVNDLGLTTSNK